MWGRGQDPRSGSRGLGPAWGGGRGALSLLLPLVCGVVLAPSISQTALGSTLPKSGLTTSFHSFLGNTLATLFLSFPAQRAGRLDDGGLLSGALSFPFSFRESFRALKFNTENEEEEEEAAAAESKYLGGCAWCFRALPQLILPACQPREGVVLLSTPYRKETKEG